MTPPGGKNKIPNRLWKARKRRGFGQKQIAFLIGKSIDEVSRYERGTRLPELQTIFAMEIAYGAPLRFLYENLYEQVIKQMRRRFKTSGGPRSVHADLLAEAGQDVKQYCAYEEMLRATPLFSPERTPVRDHVTTLAKKLAGL
jgi:transcriptional regulator with XRE-family HTH domain